MASPPAAAAGPHPSAALASALSSVVSPSLHELSRMLVELQESQQVLVGTVAAKRAELAESSAEWRAAKAALDRIPEYQAKVARIAKTMAATNALTARVAKGSAALRARVEARDAATAERQTADASAFAAVASR